MARELRWILNLTKNDGLKVIKISFQFHAMPEEYPWLIDQIARGNNLRAYLIKKSNEMADLLDISEVNEMIEHASKIAFVFELSNNRGIINETSLRNESALFLEMGELTERGLKESWIHAMSTNESIINKWRHIVKGIRNKMVSGIVARSPSGITAKVTGHRFTNGAKDAALRGVKMLPIAGNSILLPS
ncbi:hypothetical protein [Xanthomonas sacchari]|uniref:hypothetical protein n=1 Tax=Xanthomonas sacchari TaxID=56458 RepID=UPI00224FA85C|nr:hypothetical protein [Xanthomonas sacchari]